MNPNADTKVFAFPSFRVQRMNQRAVCILYSGMFVSEILSADQSMTIIQRLMELPHAETVGLTIDELNLRLSFSDTANRISFAQKMCEQLVAEKENLNLDSHQTQILEKRLGQLTQLVNRNRLSGN